MSVSVCSSQMRGQGRLWALALRPLGRLVRCGQLALIAPDGTACVARGSEDGPRAELRIVRPRGLWRVLGGGGFGFAAAYVDGDLETPDLAALLELIARNLDVWYARRGRQSLRRGVWLASRLFRAGVRTIHDLRLDRHYDLGDSFYELWLDRRMVYSAAVFDSAADDLDTAQRNKLRDIAALAYLREGHSVLEIGCGWGGFAIHAATEYGCRVTGIAVSEAQTVHARARVAAACLAERIAIRLEDYRDSAGTYDRIVSIEMFEAVGQSQWPVYFRQVRDRLVPGGRAALQIIVIDEATWPRYRRKPDFIQQCVFPGGMLPTPSALRQRAHEAGLVWLEERRIGPHYARTLALWRERFDAAWPDIRTLGFDERFRRLWRYYLSYCEAGFRTGRIDVMQIALARPQTDSPA